jgi:hypothetical protein
MSKWFEHKGCYYNLSKYYQVCLGDENEILLAPFSFNGDWEDQEDHQLTILLFVSKEERDNAISKIRDILFS